MEDFIIVDIVETDDAQIILGRPLMAIVGYHIDVRRGVTFEVQGCYTMFCYMKEKVVSPNSPLLDTFPPSPEIGMEDILNFQDPPNFDWISIEDPDQGCFKVEFAAPLPPSIPKAEVHTSNESAMSDYCRFALVVLSLPHMEGFDVDFDL